MKTLDISKLVIQKRDAFRPAEGSLKQYPHQRGFSHNPFFGLRSAAHSNKSRVAGKESSSDSVKWDPSVEDLIETNKAVQSNVKVKRRDTHKVLSLERLQEISIGVQERRGDIYDKATFLISEISRRHPFDSGNRRTAYIATKGFLESNGATFSPNKPLSDAEVLSGIRERFIAMRR